MRTRDWICVRKDRHRGRTYPFLRFVVRGGGDGVRRRTERRGRGHSVRMRRRDAVIQEAFVEIRARRGPLRGHCN